MPAVREQAFVVHLLDGDVHGHVLVAGHGDPTPDASTRREGPLELHAEPGAELVRDGDGAPHPRSRRVEDDALLDAVVAHMQPPDCILGLGVLKSNVSVAGFWRRRRRGDEGLLAAPNENRAAWGVLG